MSTNDLAHHLHRNMGHGFKYPVQRRNYWRDVPDAGTKAIKSFTPQMFTICMGSGILAVLLHNNPYQFKGLGEGGATPTRGGGH